jgi:hypothetical protein
MDIRKIRGELSRGRPLRELPLRVTFYARVSTDKTEQQGSLENQIQYYTDLIRATPCWTFAEGYVDEGISGTTALRRESFLRMIADARGGKFDFILTKEISRFSRSTLDSIRYTQELLEAGVGVLFQNDNINTLDADSEFRLVVMAGVAQDEVRKLSERLKCWATTGCGATARRTAASRWSRSRRRRFGRCSRCTPPGATASGRSPGS